MYKGIYLALSGAILKQRQMDIVSQNLSNTNTIGYKKDRISFNDYVIPQSNGIREAFDGRIMSEVSAVLTDFSKGKHIRTGNPLDIALDGEGFISLENDRYTRRGDLKIDEKGYLATQNGLKVLGNDGPIQMPKGRIEIGPSGDIRANGIPIDTLKIKDFSNLDSIIKLGEEVFSTNQEGTESKAKVQQGYLEGSNVNVIREMVLMIKTLREFEAYQKMIQAFDEATTKVTNEMGRI